MFPFDLFIFYRALLTVFLTVYTIAVVVGTAYQIAQLLRGREPARRLLRQYLAYQLVTIRVRPLAGELAQILLWLIALVGLWYLHDAGK